MEGQLEYYRRGDDGVPAWFPRYCKLRPASMELVMGKQAGQYSRRIRLTGATVAAKRGMRRAFSVKSSGGKANFRAESEQLATAWITAIQDVIDGSNQPDEQPVSLAPALPSLPTKPAGLAKRAAERSAAIKIQAAYRGHRVRKAVKQGQLAPPAPLAGAAEPEDDPTDQLPDVSFQSYESSDNDGSDLEDDRGTGVSAVHSRSRSSGSKDSKASKDSKDSKDSRSGSQRSRSSRKQAVQWSSGAGDVDGGDAAGKAEAAKPDKPAQPAHAHWRCQPQQTKMNALATTSKMYAILMGLRILGDFVQRVQFSPVSFPSDASVAAQLIMLLALSVAVTLSFVDKVANREVFELVFVIFNVIAHWFMAVGTMVEPPVTKVYFLYPVTLLAVFSILMLLGNIFKLMWLIRCPGGHCTRILSRKLLIKVAISNIVVYSVVLAFEFIFPDLTQL